MNKSQNDKSIMKNENKSKNNKVIIYISILIIIIILSLTILLNYNLLLGKITNNQSNLYVSIKDACPLLENNIEKIYVGSYAKRNVILTKTRDLYFFFINEKSECVKIDEITNVKDFYIKDYDAKILVEFMNNERKFYTFETKNNNYTINEKILNAYLFPDEKKIIKGQAITNYFTTNQNLYYIDQNNNIYDNYNNLVIKGTNFNNNVISIFDEIEENGLILKSDNLLYIFDENFKLIKKEDKFYDIKVSDIKFIYKDNDNYYIFTNQLDVYKINENKEFNHNLLYSILPIILSLAIISSYSRENPYKKSLKNFILLIIFLTIASALISFFVSRIINASLIFSIILSPVFGLIIFSIYFAFKHLIFRITDKLNTNNKLLYILIYTIILATIYFIFDLII